jgi:crotonobetainyl-CoA:carnitine CoA-transferase CaiB-like acyl-CoA transferase
MAGVLDGIVVLEVAHYWMAPSAAAILADWGADVIKVENPVGGDPMRFRGSIASDDDDTLNMAVEQCNRGKRSVAIDLSQPDGIDVLYALIRRADVFLTNYLPSVRRRLKIDVEHVKAVNPEIVYARAHGQGVRGPDADRPSFDMAAWYARSGMADVLTPTDGGVPPFLPNAMGDSIAGMALAGGIVAALFGRSRQGVAPEVDVSLLSAAMWAMSGSLTINTWPRSALVEKGAAPNPARSCYRTKDGRSIWIWLLPSDRYWAEFCSRVERPDLIDSPLFASDGLRIDNFAACRRELEEIFGTRTLEEWRQRLTGIRGAWAPVQTQSEVVTDPQVIANGYVADVQYPGGSRVSLIPNAVQFDRKPPALHRGPRLGEHTSEVLTALNRD